MDDVLFLTLFRREVAATTSIIIVRIATCIGVFVLLIEEDASLVASRFVKRSRVDEVRAMGSILYIRRQDIIHARLV